MHVTDTPINNIRPDPHQPRKTFPQDEIEELAKSIKITGIINSIEADENGFIVTGEMRWRAAQLAGLKTVPVKLIKIEGKDRLIHQMVENFHQHDMTPWDTGVALKELMKDAPKGEGANKALQEFHKGHKYVAKLIGKSPEFVRFHIALVDEISEPLRKAIRKGDISFAVVQGVVQTPEKYKAAVEKKILAGELKGGEVVRALAAAITREKNNPAAIEAMMDQNFAQGADKARLVISKMSPKLHDRYQAGLEPVKRLEFLTEKLLEWMEENPNVSIGKAHVKWTQLDLAFIQSAITKWVRRKAIAQDERPLLVTKN